MSLAIDTDLVAAVLLIDGWHEVAGNSFDLDSYEFMWEGRCVFGGGQDKLVPATGFGFNTESGTRIAGPITSVLAVRYNKAKKGSPKTK